MLSFNTVLGHYDTEFKATLGQRTFGEDQVWEIITLLTNGQLYASSAGLEKNGRGSHVYGFTSGNKEGDVWGGTVITPGSQHEISLLRVDHGGVVGILLIRYAI